MGSQAWSDPDIWMRSCVSMCTKSSSDSHPILRPAFWSPLLQNRDRPIRLIHTIFAAQGTRLEGAWLLLTLHLNVPSLCHPFLYILQLHPFTPIFDLGFFHYVYLIEKGHNADQTFNVRRNIPLIKTATNPHDVLYSLMNRIYFLFASVKLQYGKKGNTTYFNDFVSQDFWHSFSIRCIVNKVQLHIISAIVNFLQPGGSCRLKVCTLVSRETKCWKLTSTSRILADVMDICSTPCESNLGRLLSIYTCV